MCYIEHWNKFQNRLFIRPNFRVGPRRTTAIVPSTSTTPKTSAPSPSSRPTKIFPPRRKYQSQSTSQTTAAGILESQETISTTPKINTRFKFVPRKPSLRPLRTTTTSTTTTSTTIATTTTQQTEKPFSSTTHNDQASESSNQQSLEKEADKENDEESTQLIEIAHILQNIQKAPIPNTIKTTTVMPITSPKFKIRSQGSSSVFNSIDTVATTPKWNGIKRTTLSSLDVSDSDESDDFITVQPQIILNKAIVSTPQTYHSIRRVPTRSHLRYSSTTSTTIPTPLPVINTPNRGTPKPFQRVVSKSSSSNAYQVPTNTHDYYDNLETKLFSRIPEHSKVLLHSNGVIECLDQGNFPHPVSCKKFISCAKMEYGKVLGWEYTCPKGLAFDPIGGMCNWSADLCDE